MAEDSGGGGAGSGSEHPSKNAGIVPGLVVPEGYDLALGLESVGPGWGNLVREAFTLVERDGHGSRVVQVVDKWGLLVIQLAGLTPGHAARTLMAAVGYLEGASASICESCGAPGSAHGSDHEGSPAGWRKTFCESCAHRWSELGERAWPRVAGAGGLGSHTSICDPP
jgi:hypothetical protein